MGVKGINEVSNNFLVNRKIQKQVATMIIKGRTDMLPHAKQLFDRKTLNIKSPQCPWCEDTVEDTKHILVDCPKYTESREKIWNKVIAVIHGQDKMMNDLEKMKKVIPKWFKYNKLAGMLGYIPDQLKKVISNYNRMQNKETKRNNEEEKN